MINQSTFLGATIVGFNSSIGWSNEPSTLSATLVEDKANHDEFIPPPVGSPVVFSFNGWVFRGLLQNWRHSKSQSGFLYNVTVIDPREILDGVQLILGDYADTISGIPNLMNVYGYLESSGFGGSQINESGIPWTKVRDSIVSLANGANANYGGPISLRGVLYKINLSALPSVLPSSYRVGGSKQMSLMEFVDEICDAASHDFFFTLEPGNVITLSTIPRTTNPTTGLLTNFINSTSNVVSSEAGIEFRNDNVGKFLVGGNRIDMFFKKQAGNDIWPFWGFKKNLDLVVGSGINNLHEFEIDSRKLDAPGITDVYKSNVAEIRAALDGQDAWESFLEEQKAVGTAATNPHFGKFQKFNLIGTKNTNAGKDDKTQTPQNSQVTNKTQVQISSDAVDDDGEAAIARIYNFVLDFAQSYYGRQFLVSIPDVDVKKEPETDRILVSKEPVSAGFIDPAQYTGALTLNLIPEDVSRLSQDDERLPPYVRYDNIEDLDFSEIPADSIIFNNAKTSAFIKCSVNDGVAFEDVSELDGPRAVIILPGVVRMRTGDDKTDFMGGMRDRVKNDPYLSDKQKDEILNSFGVDNLYTGDLGLAVLPNLAVVPLRDNQKTYGPWQSIGANGKMEYQQDDSLVPWNYGGYAQLDVVGNAQAAISSTMQQSETGSVEIAGVPTFTMGTQIIAGGPYVTDVDVSVGQGGVTSIYRFSTWSPQFGRLRKANIDRFSRLAKSQQSVRKNLLQQFRKTPGLTNVEREVRRANKTRRKKGESSHGIISGEGFAASGSGDQIVPNVFVQPHYNFISQLGNHYDKKAAMSVDGMFRPFTTKPNASGLGIPYFEVATQGSSAPDNSGLNPFVAGHDISIVIRESALPDDLATIHSNYQGDDYRPMALRGPLVIAGYGYDTNGKPVPNSGDGTDEFLPNFRQRQDKWKVGPVDLPWDDDRKVWVGGGGSKVKLVRLASISGVFPSEFSSVYYANELTPSFSEGSGTVSLVGTDNYLFVGNYRQNLVLESSVYPAVQIGGKYYIDNQTTFVWGNL